MTTNTELIARVEAYRCFELPGQPMATHMGTSYLINDLAKAVEALEAERDDLRSQVDSLNVGFNNCQKERNAFRDERNRLNQLWGDAQALHGNRVAIETAEESLKDRMALAMEVDRLSAAGVSHCGHRPPCVECSKYAAPIPQQPAEQAPIEADMFWNHDDAETLYFSIDEFLNDEICNGTPLEVGDTRTIQCALRLPNIEIRITAVHDEECEADYEVIAASPQPKETK